MKKKFLLSIFMSTFIVGCSNTNQINVVTHTVSGEIVNGEFLFPMNTFVNLRMFNQSELDEVSNGYDNLVMSLSREVDRYHEYPNLNNLKTINDSCGSEQEIQISAELFEVLQLGISLTKLTEGRFNLAMGAIIDLYADKFIDESVGYIGTLPEKELIEEALLSIPSYEDIESIIVLNEENMTVKLNKYNNKDVIISLGAIAKGFVMDKAYDYLKKFNYHCLFDAGSSTMGTIGNNLINDNGKWNVSFKSPLIVQMNTSLLCSIEFSNDAFISTSGDYNQNFFYENENGSYNLMHHIINPNTGISNNNIRSVSVVSYNASLALLDALTTSIFNTNNDNEILSIIDKVEETYKCDIAFIVSKPYQNSYSYFDVFMSSSFEQMLISDLHSDAKNIKVVEDY